MSGVPFILGEQTAQQIERVDPVALHAATGAPIHAGYWPARDATADEKQWQATLSHIHADRQRFIDLLHDDKTDLLARIPHGTGQTILREAMLIADHAAFV